MEPNIEGLASSSAGSGGASAEDLSELTKSLAPRWFLLRNVHAEKATILMQPRWAFSFMRGPMTASEIRRARGGAK